MIEYIEYIAVAFGILYLILISNLLRWAWVCCIASAALYSFICFESSLYLQSILQLLYVLTGIWGFWNWSEMEDKGETYRLSIGRNVMFISLAGLFSLLAFYLMSFTDQQSALLDSFVFVFSILAMVLTVYRFIDNWYYWWGINILAIVMFYTENLRSTAFLYVVYFLLAVYGYLKWRSRIKST